MVNILEERVAQNEESSQFDKIGTFISFIFSADNFSDVADGWGISFSILTTKK
jgi:hypothetical protein